MKIIKYIFATIVGLVVLSYGYTYLFTAKIPEECYEYKGVYDEFVQYADRFKDDPEFSAVYQTLVSSGEKWNEVLSDGNRVKKSKLEEIRLMCTQNKAMTQKLFNIMKQQP